MNLMFYLKPRLSDSVEMRKPACLLAGAKRLIIKSLQKTQQSASWRIASIFAGLLKSAH